MYDKSDPRSALAASRGTAPAMTGLIAEPQVALFYEQPPQLEDASGKVWLHRGNNFVLAYGEAAPGGVFERKGQPDEYAVMLPNADQPARISAGGETVDVPGFSIAFVPPGDSKIEMPQGGTLVRLFTVKSDDLAEACSNAGAYDVARTHIPPFDPWPEPVGGWKIRHYSLDVPKEPGRFGRIFRCTTFMINYLDMQVGPRDITKLSPHHHDDFEQCSLAIDGSFTHHLRWAWTVNMNDWREDQHVFCGSPSSTVIPPPVIHTTRGMEAGDNQLVDIFCPPRMDFSQKEGWVLNADDYPMPQQT